MQGDISHQLVELLRQIKKLNMKTCGNSIPSKSYNRNKVFLCRVCIYDKNVASEKTIVQLHGNRITFQRILCYYFQKFCKTSRLRINVT